MKLYVVSVRDTAVNAFEAPFFVRALGEAMRGFGDAVSDPNSPISKHPTDYLLYEFGTFDTESGVFDVHAPEQLARAADFVK